MSKLTFPLAVCCLFFVPCLSAPVVAGTRPHSHYERPLMKGGPYKKRVVVFVHGIFGDGDTTWRYSPSVYWPKLLLTDNAFQDFDVYVASYASPYIGNTMNMEDIVSNLNNRLVADEVFSQHSDVVFVCHSMGGLIVQRLLLTFRQYAPQVSFIYFFSTPQTGAQIAKLASAFSSDPLLKTMIPGDEDVYLQNLEDEWRAARFPIHRLCAFERRKYHGVLIVDRLSATRDCENTPLAINEDHVSIVKPDSASHDSYLALRNAVRDYPLRDHAASLKPIIQPKPGVLPSRSKLIAAERRLLSESRALGKQVLDIYARGPIEQYYQIRDRVVDHRQRMSDGMSEQFPLDLQVIYHMVAASAKCKPIGDDLLATADRYQRKYFFKNGKARAIVDNNVPALTNDEVPTVDGGFHDVPDTVNVMLGSNGVHIGWWYVRATPWQPFVDVTPMTISIRNGNLFFTFQSQCEGVPIKIVNNAVTVGSYLVDYQMSQKELEVVDRSQEPIFQMIRRNAGTIQINGIFDTGGVNKRGEQILLWASEDAGWTFSAKKPLGFRLKPLFRYPSAKYPGVYADDERTLAVPPQSTSERDTIDIAGMNFSNGMAALAVDGDPRRGVDINVTGGTFNNNGAVVQNEGPNARISIQDVNASGNRAVVLNGPIISPPAPPPDSGESEKGKKAPMPAGSIRIASQKQIPSAEKDFPYGLEVVVTTDTSASPTALKVHFTDEVGKLYGGPPVSPYVQAQGGIVSETPRIVFVEWAGPNFEPEHPLILTVFSKTYLQAESLESIPFEFPYSKALR